MPEMRSIESLTSPVLLFVVQQVVILLFAGFTAKDSPFRLAIGLPVVTALAWQITTTVPQRVFLTNVRSFLALQSTTQVLHFIDVLLVGKWDFDIGGPQRIIWHAKRAWPSASSSRASQTLGTSLSKEQPATHSSSITARLMFGLHALVDNRGTNEPWESKGTPPFSTLDPSWVPTRRSFLVTRALKVIGLYLFLDLLTAWPPEDAASPASPARIDLFQRWHEVTFEELAVRTITTTITWAAIISLISLVYDSMSLIAVAFSVSEPRDWRPMINSPLEAYTVRRFWSPFYHQFLRRRLASVAVLVTDDLLGLARGSFAGKYLSLFMVFLASAIVHLPSDVGQGLSLRDSRTMVFFMAQFVAICVEDLIGWMVGPRGKRPRWWLRLVGNLWVVIFMGLTVPYWLWPLNALDLTVEQRRLFPISLVRTLTSS